MSRTCDAMSCSAETDTGRFMCPRHWRMVPVNLQTRINAAYKAHESKYDLLRNVDYVEACALAIEGIAKVERQKSDNSYRRLLPLVQRLKQGGA